MTLDVPTLDEVLLVGAGVLLLAILAVRLSVRLGLPSLMLYLLIGIGLGEAGLGIQFEDVKVTAALGFAALVVILAEGGLTTPLPKIMPVMRLGMALAIVGTAVSVLVVAAFAHYVLGMSWQLAVLLGAVTSPTDAAAVFSVLRRVPLPRRLMGVLETESGLNDAPTVVLVTLVSTPTLSYSPLQIAGIVVLEMILGVAAGWVIGRVGIFVLRRVALPSSGLYPLAVFALAVVAYAGTAALNGSGFAAVYVAALLLGNAELPHRAATRSFVEGLAWLAQIGLFVMLGLLVSPGRIDADAVIIALLTGLVLTFIARPVSVAVSALAQRLPIRELCFIGWTGLRGAVPIVLTTIPLAENVKGATELFDVVFVLVVVLTLVTGPTLPVVAKYLKVVRRSEPMDLDIEAAPMEKLAADLLQVSVPNTSKLHGVEVGELRLPNGVSVSMVVRGDQVVVPDQRTVLRQGDDILIVTPRRLREATETRLQEVSLGGRLARWLSEDPTMRTNRAER